MGKGNSTGSVDAVEENEERDRKITQAQLPEQNERIKSPKGPNANNTNKCSFKMKLRKSNTAHDDELSLKRACRHFREKARTATTTEHVGSQLINQKGTEIPVVLPSAKNDFATNSQAKCKGTVFSSRRKHRQCLSQVCDRDSRPHKN